jgi:hypothetical protein
VSYDLVVAGAAPGWRALRAALPTPDLAGLPEANADDGWPGGRLRLHRAGVSTRATELVAEREGRVRIEIRALAAPEDYDLALDVAEALARVAGVAAVEADYFGAVPLPDLRRLHGADWRQEQALSGARALAALIAEGRGPIAVPGPVRACWIGARLLGELERAGPPATLPDRMIATVRQLQWDLPAGTRDAGVFVSGGAAGDADGAGAPARETRFAVWLPDEALVIPRVDYVALRAATGDVVMVSAATVPALAGPRATPLDECQLLVPPIPPDEWAAIVARARPLAATPRR